MHKKGVPEEWNELILCRDVYHCTHTELDEQDYLQTQLDIEMLSVEAEVASIQALKR